MFRADFYLQNILNTLDMTDKPLFNDPIFQNISHIGAVNLEKKADWCFFLTFNLAFGENIDHSE